MIIIRPCGFSEPKAGDLCIVTNSDLLWGYPKDFLSVATHIVLGTFLNEELKLYAILGPYKQDNSEEDSR